MSDGFGFVNDLTHNTGQTVTIFTTSGGESGRGFTGASASADDDFVRLITQIGSAPGCALGNCCEHECHMDGGRYFNNSFDCSGRNFGSIVNIPVNRIAAFVHNAVGSSW